MRSQQINSTGTKIFEVLPLSGVIPPYGRATLTALFKPVSAGRVKGFKATAPPSDEAFTYACQLSFDGYAKQSLPRRPKHEHMPAIADWAHTVHCLM